MKTVFLFASQAKNFLYQKISEVDGSMGLLWTIYMDRGPSLMNVLSTGPPHAGSVASGCIAGCSANTFPVSCSPPDIIPHRPRPQRNDCTFQGLTGVYNALFGKDNADHLYKSNSQRVISELAKAGNNITLTFQKRLEMSNAITGGHIYICASRHNMPRLWN